MNRKYVLMLTADERARLEGIVRTGKCAAWKIERAHALLKMDRGEDGPGWSDDRIAEAFGMTTRILEKWRKRAVEEGLDMVLERQYAKQRPQTRKLDGDGEAELTRLACSQAPDDSVSWTLELLANKLGGVANRGYDIARDRAADVKKNELKPWLKQICWPTLVSSRTTAGPMCPMTTPYMWRPQICCGPM